MSSCNPLALAEDFIAKLRRLRDDAAGVLDGVPDTLEDLLQCITFGHATSSVGVLDPNSLEAFDLDAIEDRVQQIFDSVSSSQSSLLDSAIDTPATQALAGATAAAGLWMLVDPGGTFYGLARARTERAMESALAMEEAILRAEAALQEVERVADQLSGPVDEDLLRRARKLVEETCPEIAEIQAQLRAISLGVSETNDLGNSMCGATSLQERCQALIDSLPQDVAGAVRLLEAVDQLQERVDVIDVLTTEMNDSADRLVAFDEQFEAGSFATQTEQRIYEELAQQFSDVCEAIAALAAARRYSEMLALEPEIRNICAITIATLRMPPSERLTIVLEHPAREPFAQWTASLASVPRADPGNDAMEGLFGSLPGQIVDKSDQLLFAVQDVRKVFSDAKRLRDIYLTAGGEFLALTQETVDQVCTGALKRLLFKYGYEVLEELFAKGLFGDLPEALFRASTTAGQAVDCLRGLTEGSLGLLEPLTGEQRFAIEATADTLRVLENSTHLVARLAQELELKAPSPAAAINDIAAVLEREAKGALRNIGVSLPEIPGTRQSEDGFIEYVGDVLKLPEGIIRESSGYLRALSGASIPDGYGRSPEGYLIATP